MDSSVTISNLKESYYELAATELVMSNYSLCEAAADEDMEDGYRKVAIEYKAVREEIQGYVKTAFGSDAESKAKALEKVKSLRDRLKEKVNSLILFGDRKLIDEYVMSRKGNDGEQPEYGNDDDYAREILAAVFESNDNNIINENILSTVYELPIRMTKTRFFDILDDGFKKYIGSPADVLDKFLFLTESAAGLSEGADFDESFDDDRIANEIDYLTSLAELVNYVYVMLLTDTYCDETLKEKVRIYLPVIEASKVIADRAEGYEKSMQDAILLLEKTEGKPENLLDKVNSLSGKFENIVNSEKGAFEEEKKLFDTLDRLMSNSVFAELAAQDESAVSEEKVHEEYEKLCAKLKAVFENGDRSRNRAVMASVLKELPVFFNSRTDVMNYVRESLSSCRDVYEKSVAISRLMEKLKG